MRRWTWLFLIIALYILKLYFTSPEIFSYRFNPNLIKHYFCSQDIPHEVPCKREFLSDGDLHIATGYLYIKGYDPSQYHFQHTPFIEYLYGLTIILFNNPYYLEILFVVLYLILSYIFVLKVYNSTTVAIFTCLFLSLGPLLNVLSTDASLDVGQAVLMLIYGLLVLFKPKQYLLQGLFLGLFASAKFWGAVPFFVLMFNGYNLFKHRLSIKTFVFHLLVGFLSFSLTYIVSFINNHGNFNIIFFQLKILKYWFNHSVASIPFSSIVLFLTGYHKSWWDKQEIVRGEVWNMLWPISVIISTLVLKKDIVSKQINKKTLLAFIPLAYLVYLGAQAPFIRYFILILPFFYSTTIYYFIINLDKNINNNKELRLKRKIR